MFKLKLTKTFAESAQPDAHVWLDRFITLDDRLLERILEIWLHRLPA